MELRVALAEPWKMPVTTAFVTADTLVFTGLCYVHWILIWGQGSITWELNDSTDNTGTDLIGGGAASGAGQYYVFSPPIQFGTGLYVDLSATSRITVGYSEE